MDFNHPDTAWLPGSCQEREGAIALPLLAQLAWLWLLCGIPFLTDVCSGFIVGSLLALTWLALALAWLVLPLCQSGCLTSPKKRRWYLAAGAAGLLGLVLGFTDVGLRLRLIACAPSLTAYAQVVPAGERLFWHEPRWVGLFRVDGTEERNGVVLLYTSTGFLDRYGLAYSRDGKEPRAGPHAMRHLFGPWYSFRWKF